MAEMQWIGARRYSGFFENREKSGSSVSWYTAVFSKNEKTAVISIRYSRKFVVKISKNMKWAVIVETDLLPKIPKKKKWR